MESIHWERRRRERERERELERERKRKIKCKIQTWLFDIFVIRCVSSLKGTYYFIVT